MIGSLHASAGLHTLPGARSAEALLHNHGYAFLLVILECNHFKVVSGLPVGEGAASPQLNMTSSGAERLIAAAGSRGRNRLRNQTML